MVDKNLFEKVNEVLKLKLQDKNELIKKFNEVIKEYNESEEDNWKISIADIANTLLDIEERTTSKKEAIYLCSLAYEICPECFDALLINVRLEDNSIKQFKLLEKGLEIEKKRLEKEKYFQEEMIGEFYGVFETRPYIRGLYTKAKLLLDSGMVTQAENVCKEILRLNTSDNTGARYLLMAIYAYFENEKELLKLVKKYNEEHFETLFPLFALYYKLGDEEKTKEYFRRLNKSNPYFIKYFKGGIEAEKDAIRGYYSKGNPTEIIMYFSEYRFLTNTMENIHDYVSEYSKKNK